MLALLRLDGDAGIVADALPHAGQGVEERGLAGVGVADQGDRDGGGGGGHIVTNPERKRRDSQGCVMSQVPGIAYTRLHSVPVD